MHGAGYARHSPVNVGDQYGKEVGYITDEPGFRYELVEGTPHREEIEALIQEPADWKAPRYGGAEDPDSSCGGYTRVPATDRDRVVLLERRRRGVTSVTVEREK